MSTKIVRAGMELEVGSLGSFKCVEPYVVYGYPSEPVVLDDSFTIAQLEVIIELMKRASDRIEGKSA